MRKYIPIGLIFFRVILAPLILGLVYFLKDKSRTEVVILMYFGLFSDIFDGIIARQLNVSSQRLRRFDSQTDMIFWVSIGISTWLLYPELIRNNRIPIIVIFVMEGMLLFNKHCKVWKRNMYSCVFIKNIWNHLTDCIHFVNRI